MRVALAGSGRLAIQMMHAIRASRHEIVAIVQDGRRCRGMWRWLDPWTGRLLTPGYNLAGWSGRLRAPVVYIDKMDETELAPLRAARPDLLLVGGFGIILKAPLLELPAVGCVNCHSSLLPRHRGPNPFAAVILDGDAENGVTFHVMDAGIDTGDILEQSAYAVTSEDTAFSVYRKACAVAADRIAPLLDHIEAHGLHGRPQDNALASYDPKPPATPAGIDWNQPAEHIDRLVRAFAPSPMPRFRHRGRAVRVARTAVDATPVDAVPGTVLRNRLPVRVATGAGTLIIPLAFCGSPVPSVWPAPWNRPAIGERLEPGP